MRFVYFSIRPTLCCLILRVCVYLRKKSREVFQVVTRMNVGMCSLLYTMLTLKWNSKSLHVVLARLFAVFLMSLSFENQIK